MIERGVILAEPGQSIDVQHLFAGGEKLNQDSFALGATGALVPSGTATGANIDQRGSSLADELIDRLASFSEIESLLLDRAMTRSNGNVAAAARLLSLKRGQVEYRLRKIQEKGS